MRQPLPKSASNIPLLSPRRTSSAPTTRRRAGPCRRRFIIGGGGGHLKPLVDSYSTGHGPVYGHDLSAVLQHSHRHPCQYRLFNSITTAMCPLVVSFGVIESPPRTSCTKRLWERAGIEVPDGQCIDHRGPKQAEQRPLAPTFG